MQFEKEGTFQMSPGSEPRPTPKPQPLPTETFYADDIEYRFIHGKFRIPDHQSNPPGIAGEYTAEEALQNEDLLAYLVEIKSGVIQAV